MFFTFYILILNGYREFWFNSLFTEFELSASESFHSEVTSSNATERRAEITL